MLLEDLIITDTSKENVFELQENYPCCSRDMVITAGNSRVVPWHWHEELEILYVREGEIDYWTAGNCIRLRKSDGIFINTNVMHQVIFPQEMEDARSQVFMFRPEFLAEEGSLYIKNISALFCMITNFRRRCCVEKVKCREKCWKICWKWIESRTKRHSDMRWHFAIR